MITLIDVTLLLLYIVVIFVVFLLWRIMYLKLRSKGFSPPASTLLILLSLSIGLLSGFLYIQPKDLSTYHGFLYYSSIPFFLAVLTTYILVAVAPKRKMRIFGPRKVKVPYEAIGVGILLLGAIGITYIIYDWGTEDVGLTIQGVLCVLSGAVPFSLYFFYSSSREKAKSLDHALASDKRSPVLYLRSFKQESEAFIIGKMEKLRPYFTNWFVQLTTQNHNVVGLTFEEYLSKEIEKQLGPFVALGSPEDYLPPEGASRLYASDKNWMNCFNNLLSCCSCILVEVGESSNLKWELKQIKERGLEEKLFILTSMTEKRHLNWIAGFFEWLKGLFIPPVKTEWSLFSDKVSKLGYKLPEKDPGYGCVFAFEEGKSRLMISGAQKPEDFISVISVWLKLKNLKSNPKP